MRSTLTALVRLGVFLGVVATASAIGLARLVPEDPPHRGPASASLSGVNAIALLGPDRTGLVGVDRESGAVVSRAIGEGEWLDMVSTSPWSDESGEVQVIGRWKHRLGINWNGDLYVESGLALARYPSGQVLHRLPTELSATGPPAWRPGESSQIIVPGWDGRLHRVTTKRIAGEVELTEPVRIEWEIAPPAEGVHLVCDPVWPSDPRFRGKLLVSLRTGQRREGQRREGQRGSPVSRLWWFDLDPSGRWIVAAGCMTIEDDAAYRRCPSPVTLEDGRPGLAYLVRRRPPLYELRSAPLEFDAKTGEPRLKTDEERTLATGCSEAGRITVSADGTRLTSFSTIALQQAQCIQVTLGPAARPAATEFALLNWSRMLQP